MIPIWTEANVTLTKIADHMIASGISFTSQDEDRIRLHTEIGIAFSVVLDEDGKFIRLSTYFPLDPEQSLEKKRDLERLFNAEILLPSFSLDHEDDLNIVYVISYRFGLIPGQLMYLVKRFESLLNYLVNTRNPDGLILLGKYRQRSDMPDLDDAPPPEKVLLN